MITKVRACNRIMELYSRVWCVYFSAQDQLRRLKGLGAAQARESVQKGNGQSACLKARRGLCYQLVRHRLHTALMSWQCHSFTLYLNGYNLWYTSCQFVGIRQSTRRLIPAPNNQLAMITTVTVAFGCHKDVYLFRLLHWFDRNCYPLSQVGDSVCLLQMTNYTRGLQLSQRLTILLVCVNGFCFYINTRQKYLMHNNNRANDCDRSSIDVCTNQSNCFVLITFVPEICCPLARHEVHLSRLSCRQSSPSSHGICALIAKGFH